MKKREPLYELDTDKVTQEVEAEADGVLLKIVVSEGEVEVGRTVAVIGKAGDEDVSGLLQAEEAAAGNGGAAKVPEAKAEAQAAPPAPPAEVVERSGVTGRLKASPLARRLARERGVDLAGVQGTGPEGRIVAEDVEKAAVGAPAAAPAARLAATPSADVEVVELTKTRKTIARRLTEAWQAPVFQLGVSAEMTEALALREQLVARLGEGDAKPTVNDVLTKLVAVALTRHPAVNATFTGDEIHRSAAANVGIAVAAPNGLIVPVIANADRLTVQEIARAARRPRRPCARRQAHAAGSRGRHVHDLDPRHVRRRAVRCGAQSAAGRHPCGRRRQGERRSPSTARSTSRRSCSSRSPATTV